MLNRVLYPSGHYDVWTTTVAIGITIALAWACALLLFYTQFDLLASYPGPKVARFTRLWYAIHLFRGTLLEELLKAHEKYGYVVRIAPDELSYICPEAWDDIYGSKVVPEMTRDPRFMQDVGGQGQSLLHVTHERHRAMRKKLAHGFSAKSLRDTESLRTSYVDSLIQRLSENSQNGEVLDLVKWYSFLSYDIQSDLAFGKSFDCLKTSSFHPWMQLIAEFDKIDPFFRAITHFPWALKLMQYLTPRYVVDMEAKLSAMSMEKAKGRMARPVGRPDFLEHFMQTTDALSEADVCANAVAMIGAGGDTTATLLSGTTFFLLQNPQLLTKLSLQLRQCFKSESEIDQAAADGNSLLQACVLETLRVYPPAAVGFTRVVPKSGATIAGRFVPEGITFQVLMSSAPNAGLNQAILSMTRKAYFGHLHVVLMDALERGTMTPDLAIPAPC
ncbi:Cytochrome P450 [Penicillium concentricum]|uniref:Cytochrome P450 n=1 Tax=Penicillium concentricum TaxID=293559 RepID=A0A9W9VIX9_9EURO|nr:Cytochrome P450 [Penicillium concentricum]KAJ5382509.1 Cytochrome P450 [Penicillium concentricum]